LDDALEDADDLARSRGGVVVAAQQIERGVADRLLRVLRLDDALEEAARLLVALALGLGEERPHRGERARRIVQAVEPARRDAGAGPLAILLRLAVEAALPQRDQIGPPLVALEQALERRPQLGVVRGEREQALQVADRL